MCIEPTKVLVIKEHVNTEQNAECVSENIDNTSCVFGTTYRNSR